MSYGIEVWGANTVGTRAFTGESSHNPMQSMLSAMSTDPCERLQLTILKWVMGVGKRTSNAAIWGDCGRPPIIVRFVKQMTDYFNRLSKLDVEDSNTLVRYAFAEQKNLGLSWFKNLDSMMRILDHDKFEHQYYNALLCQERAHNRFAEVWEKERQRNSKLSFYNEIKESIDIEPYLKIESGKGSNLVARIRMSSHKLNVETGRYGSKSASIVNRACNFCCHLPTLELLSQLPEANPIIEDEIHFLESCPRYQTLRGSIKEPTKTLLLNGDYKTLFLDEHIGEFTKFLAQIFKKRFPAKK